MKIQIVYTLSCFLLIMAGCDKDQKVVSIHSPIIDEGQFISDLTEAKMLSIIERTDSIFDVQLAVVAIYTLQGESLEKAGLRMAEEMKLGNSRTNAGLLLLYSHQERGVRIEIGEGLELVIGDEIAARIIREKFILNYKNDNPDASFLTSIEELVKHVQQNQKFIGVKYDDGMHGRVK